MSGTFDVIKLHHFNVSVPTIIMGETPALIREGGGGGYSHIRVLLDEFLLKSVVFKFVSKEISRTEHEYMNITPPPSNARAFYSVSLLFKCV